jgi:hypothetical protein
MKSGRAAMAALTMPARNIQKPTIWPPATHHIFQNAQSHLHNTWHDLFHRFDTNNHARYLSSLCICIALGLIVTIAPECKRPSCFKQYIAQ